MTSTEQPPHPQRRRGAVLEDAILDAAYDELTEAGYAAFSVESVATRAQTGKASIYRRWPTKQLLVMDALGQCLPGPVQSDLVAGEPLHDVSTAEALRRVGALIVATLNGPAGRAIRAVKLESVHDPELAALVDERFQAPRRAAMLGLLRRGVERGEVRPEAVSDLVADVLPAVLMQRVLMQREAVSRKDIEAVIEQVMIPLVSIDRS